MQQDNKLQDYKNTIEKVIVTYADGSKKEFTPYLWFCFEDGIREMKKTKIQIIKKSNTD